MSDALDRLFTDWEGRPGGAVSVVHQGTTVHHSAYGLADISTGTPFATDMPFPIASVTKQFVAYVVLTLEAEGALRRDDEIHVHLPELGDLGAPVTIEHLLRHRSGIRDHITLATLAGGRLLEGLTRDSIRRLLLGQRSLDFAPGSAAVYSNSNYVLLSWVIERVSGQSLGDVLTSLVFAPLAMSSTRLVEDPMAGPATAMVGYAGSTAAGFRPWHFSAHVTGEGGIWSTLDDLSRWMHHISDPTPRAAGLLEAMMRAEPLTGGGSTDYLVGLREGTFLGERWVGHSGGWEGYRSQTCWFPARRLGVVVIANQTIDPTAAALEVADQFLPEPAMAIAGTYVSTELDASWVVELDGSAVLVSVSGPFGRIDRLPLRRTGSDTYALARAGFDRWDLEFDTEITFQPGSDGRCSGLTVRAGIVHAARFDRVR